MNDIISKIENEIILLDGMNKKWLRYKLKVYCHCNSTCILYNYFKHCHSKKHNRYLNDNNILSVYTIKTIL